MKKNELLLFAAPLLVIVALVVSTAGTKYVEKYRRSQETITVRAGVFNKEVGSRMLLQKLSAALKAHPDNNGFELRWNINMASNEFWPEMLTLTYNRHDGIVEQGGLWGFRYGKVTEAAIHDMAKNDKTVVRLAPQNYSSIHIFTEKQRLSHGIEILPTEPTEDVVTVVEKQP